jgi:hypothetical protein
MERILHLALGLIFIGAAIPQIAISKSTVEIENATGERIEIGFDANDRFLDVLDLIQSYFQNDREVSDGGETGTLTCGTGQTIPDLQWNLEISHAGLSARAQKADWRVYKVHVSKEEKKNIRFIVTTLASGSLFTIGKKSSDLKEAGKRIDHLHPFRFLMTIFTDEELKAGIAAIRDYGGWVGSEFFDGIKGSLEEEAKQENLHQFTGDFAQKVKIDENLISPLLKQGKWLEFVNILIDKIPREIDPNHYNF